jgi:uncharacterized protein (UPF0297 family)
LGQLAADTDMTDPYRVLYPIKKEFTYVPNARINLNRSRLDFFLIKKSLADQLIDCSIASSLSSTSFDHKKISLNLGSTKKNRDFNKIDNNLLKNRGINLMVKIRVLECYIVNADPDSVPRYQTRNLLIDIGRIDHLIKEWIKDELDIKKNHGGRRYF